MKKQAQRGGLWLPYMAGIFACVGIAGTLWALSEALESDNDGWTDSEEILAGTNPNDPPQICGNTLALDDIMTTSNETEHNTASTLSGFAGSSPLVPLTDFEVVVSYPNPEAYVLLHSYDYSAPILGENEDSERKAL